MRRLLLVRHAPTSATRRAAFPADEPLDDRARVQAARLAEMLPSRCQVVSSPTLRCRQTAEAAGLDPKLDRRLAECDFGSWSGRSLADIHESEPDAVEQWMTLPDARPHGGESLAAFSRRIALWLDGEAREDGSLVAITHAGVVKAAIVHALAAPITTFWRIDVSPLAITELHGRDGRWTLTRINCAGGGETSPR